MEVSFAHQYHAGRKWRDYGAHDLRARFLERLRQNADAKLKRSCPRKSNLEAIVRKIDVVGRVSFPHRQNHVDGFAENLVAIFVEYSDCLGIRGQRTGAYAHDEATLR